MRVLVTRPEASAGTTLRRLGEAGHEALCLPMTWAEHCPDGTPPAFDAVSKGGPSSALPLALAVTSAEAIKALRALPDRLAALRSWPVYGVGPVTARGASDAGFGDIRMGPGNGEGLARRVVADHGVVHRGIVYCAGLPRAPDFERILAEAGVPMEVVLVYRMRPVYRAAGELRTAIEAFSPEAILFHSREAVHLFFAAIAPAELNESVRILCLASRIAAAVPPGCRHVQVAPLPDEPALIALLDA